MKNEYEIRGDTTAIYIRARKLTLITFIDTEDLSKTLSNPYSWYGAKIPKYGFYVCSSIPPHGDVKGHKILLHRFILDPPQDLVIDHIDHDALNNRKSNLRLVTQAQNQQNRMKACRNNQNSKTLNVYPSAKGSWVVRLELNGQGIYCGTYHNKKAAIAAAEKARAKYMPYSQEALRS